MSWAQSLHGLFEMSFFVVVVDFEGPTVGVVVADRLDETTVVALEDILETKLEAIGVEYIMTSRDQNIKLLLVCKESVP